MLIPIEATGYSNRNGEFREVIILPQTADDAPERKPRAFRITADWRAEVYNGTIWIPIGGTGAGGSKELFGQFVVGGGTIADGATIYENSELIGKYIDVVYQGAILPTDLEDQLSYLYDITTGKITFNAPLSDTFWLRIYIINSGSGTGGIAIVPTYSALAASATGSPHFIQVQSDENEQEVGGNAPITLYYWNGVEVILITSKVPPDVGPSPGIQPLTFTERVAIIQDGSNFIGDGPGGVYAHYALCDLKLPDGVDGSVSYDLGGNGAGTFIGFRDDDVNGHYTDFGTMFVITIGNGIYALPDDPIGTWLPGDKIRLRRTADVVYVDQYTAGAWAVIYTYTGTFPGDKFIGISLSTDSTIENPMGENLIPK